MAGGGTPGRSRVSSADEKHALFPPAPARIEFGGARHEPLRGASQPNTHGPAPYLGAEGVNRLSYRVSPLETRPRVLRRRDASVVVNGSAGIGALPRAPPGRSRGLATSQTMDGSPSLRRRHRTAARSSWAGSLHARPLVSPLYRTAIDRRNLAANQPLFLRNGTAAIVMHKALYGTAAKLKYRSFADSVAYGSNDPLQTGRVWYPT